MSLRDWIASFPIPATATPATLATDSTERVQLSQLSQLSQSQVSAGESVEGGDDDREAFEERAAIMEYDGGLTREEGERLAGEGVLTPSARARAHAREDCGPRVSAAVRWRGEELDLGDLRPCLWCRNLSRSGRCSAAWRGELRAARDWGPTFPGQPQRCIGYAPMADDPDQRPGSQRWPELVEWQARLKIGS